MVMAVLHATGDDGLVGSAELLQLVSSAANATHTGIRINLRNLPSVAGSPDLAPVRNANPVSAASPAVNPHGHRDQRADRYDQKDC